MTRREFAEEYGVSASVIKHISVKRMNAMGEDARRLLIGMSKRHAETLKNSRLAAKRVKRKISIKAKSTPNVERIIELAEKRRVA